MSGLTNQDKLKWYMLLTSGSLFCISVVVKLFKPATQINIASNVFLGICALVLGSAGFNYFNNNKEDK